MQSANTENIAESQGKISFILCLALNNCVPHRNTKNHRSGTLAIPCYASIIGSCFIKNNIPRHLYACGVTLAKYTPGRRRTDCRICFAVSLIATFFLNRHGKGKNEKDMFYKSRLLSQPEQRSIIPCSASFFRVPACSGKKQHTPACARVSCDVGLCGLFPCGTGRCRFGGRRI